MNNINSLSVEKKSGNTPLKNIPLDYMPENSGHWLVLNEGLDAGKKLFYYDITVGEGEPESIILFVHGNPESSYTYSHVRDEIIQNAKKTCRIIAMDHIGFGLSDQASYEMIDVHHASNLKQLIQHLNLSDITLVIHDWGGAIGIGALIDEPKRVSNLVLMNTTVFPIPLQGINYAQGFPFKWISWNTIGYRTPWQLWRHVAPMVMTTPAGKWNFCKHVGNYTVRALTDRLTDNEKVYRDMFTTRTNSLSSKRNVKQTKVWGHGYYYSDPVLGYQDNFSFYNNIQTKITDSWGENGQNIGVRAFFGLWDPLARPEVQQQWLTALPQLAGHIKTYENVGHFVEETKYVDIAEGIMNTAQLD